MGGVSEPEVLECDDELERNEWVGGRCPVEGRAQVVALGERQPVVAALVIRPR